MNTKIARRDLLGRAASVAAGAAVGSFGMFSTRAVAQEPVKITLWGWWDVRMKLYADAAVGFMEQNPDVVVEVVTLPGGQDMLTRLYSALPAGNGPTMLKMGEFIFQLRDEDLLVPFPENLLPDNWLRTTYPNFDWETYGRYVVPTGTSASVLVYNKAMFAEAGLDPNTPPRSWDELIAAAKALTQTDGNGAIARAGFVPNEEFRPLDYLYQLGGNIVSRESGQPVVTFDTPEMRQAYQFLADLELEHKVWSHDFLLVGQAIGSGAAAMTICESWLIGEWRDNFPDILGDLGFAAPPTPTGDRDPSYGRKSLVLDISVMNGRPVEEQEAAFRFLEYFYKERLDIQFQLIDLVALAAERLDLLEDPRIQDAPWLGVMPEFAAHQHDPVQLTGDLDMVMNDVLTLILVSGQSVPDAVRYGQEQVQALFDGGTLNYLK